MILSYERNYMNKELIEEFHNKMKNIYYDAKKEVKYNATRFFSMIEKYGGYETAKKLLVNNDNTQGFTTLFMLGRKDFTMEYLIVYDQKFHCLFSTEELLICKQRLGVE